MRPYVFPRYGIRAPRLFSFVVEIRSYQVRSFKVPAVENCLVQFTFVELFEGVGAPIAELALLALLELISVSPGGRPNLPAGHACADHGPPSRRGVQRGSGAGRCENHFAASGRTI
jgi:hypothetical protein